MISLISPALIMIGPSRFLGLLEPLADAGELAVQAAVDEVRSDLGHESAEEAVVHLLLDDHLPGARHAGQPRAHGVALAVRERHAGANLRAHAAEVLVDHVAIRPR